MSSLTNTRVQQEHTHDSCRLNNQGDEIRKRYALVSRITEKTLIYQGVKQKRVLRVLGTVLLKHLRKL